MTRHPRFPVAAIFFAIMAANHFSETFLFVACFMIQSQTESPTLGFLLRFVSA